MGVLNFLRWQTVGLMIFLRWQTYLEQRTDTDLKQFMKKRKGTRRTTVDGTLLRPRLVLS